MKLPKITTAHTTNLPTLTVAEDTCVKYKFLILKLHASRIENLFNLGPTLKDKFCVTFAEVVSNIFQEVFRWVYSNLLVESEGAPQTDEYFYYGVI